MGRIVWLASYPKSGNTWVRAVLTNYLIDGAAPASINDLVGRIASDRRLFDDLTGVEASDLTAAETASYRAEAYRLLAQEHDGLLYLKIHDAPASGSVRLIPDDVTAAAIYIARNPLDVAVSLASHLDCPIDEAVARICDGLTLAEPRGALRMQIEQRVLSWGAHVRSWLDDQTFPVHCVRYEDMVEHPHDAFRGIVEATGQPVDEQRLSRAIDRSTFRSLQTQEESSGFAERLSARSRFFRSGRSGQWQEALQPAQVRRVVGTHSAEMQRFGYVSEVR